MQPSKAHIAAIHAVLRPMGGQVLDIKPLGESFGGHVYKTTMSGTEAKNYVVKFMAREDEQPMDQENAHNRVYSSRWSNFVPAYDLMTQAGLPVPHIFETGVFENLNFAVMEFLPGISVREHLMESNGDLSSLHQAAGTCFGRLHTITRDYAGWVSEKPYATSWRDDLLNALGNNLDYLEQKQSLPQSQLAMLRKMAQDFSRELVDPPHFVLSHTDGFQGMAEQHGGAWRISGIVDIEDHQFTDRRFVLAGHELALEMNGRKPPEEFWQAYRSETAIDPSYDAMKNYFKLFYLSSWLDTFLNTTIGAPRDRPALIQKTKQRLQGLIPS